MRIMTLVFALASQLGCDAGPEPLAPLTLYPGPCEITAEDDGAGTFFPGDPPGRYRFVFDAEAGTTERILATAPGGWRRLEDVDPNGVTRRIRTEHTGERSTDYTYDADGRLIAEHAWTDNEDAQVRHVYAGDRLVRSEYMTRWVEEGSESAVCEYEHDAEGRITNERCTQSGYLIGTHERTYTENTMLRRGPQDECGVLTTYDDAGRAVEVLDQCRPDSYSYRAWRYDAAGRIVEETVWNRVATKEYDAAGNLTVETFHQVDGAYIGRKHYDYRCFRESGLDPETWVDGP